MIIFIIGALKNNVCHMFRHQGKKRKVKHNVQLASYLSFVAGVVNITGFLVFHELTTNITGHFTFLVADVGRFDASAALRSFSYVSCFFVGAFISSLLIEFQLRVKTMNKFVLPILLECVVLVTVLFLNRFRIIELQTPIICLLLFAMGLQNAFVSKISHAVVRTTHLTGLFTDFGIELAQLLFRRDRRMKSQLISAIMLRITIVTFFFLGGFIAALLFTSLHLNTLWLAVVVLCVALLHDEIRMMLFSKRKNKFDQRARN